MDFFQHPTEPFRVERRSLARILEDMAKTGFQGRRMGEAFLTWREMLKDGEATIFMGLSGAMVPAGMRRVISYLIRKNYIDVLVSTGANLFHDMLEALGGKHYRGSHLVDDRVLYREGIDRMYDVLAREEKFREMDRLIGKFAGELPGQNYSSREFMHRMGERVKEEGGAADSILVSAYEEELPVFVPALSDSSIGIGLLLARHWGSSIAVDHTRDADELMGVVEKSEKTGVVYIGGGVPKNFINQTEMIAPLLGLRSKGHGYALQFTTDSPQWGGLSGSTFDEGISWGKITANSKKAQVFVDATIALPIVVNALDEERIERKRSRASFF